MICWKAGLALAAALAVAAQATTPWTLDEREVLRSLSLEILSPLPADPSNRVADDPPAAALGQALFSDGRLSSNGRVYCASCHQPTNGFTDQLWTGNGVGTGTRRTMPIRQAVYSPWQFWDGRADSLCAQALGPIENPLKHNFTRTQVARLLVSRYRSQYEKLFGTLPNLSDAPDHGNAYEKCAILFRKSRLVLTETRRAVRRNAERLLALIGFSLEIMSQE